MENKEEYLATLEEKYGYEVTLEAGMRFQKSWDSGSMTTDEVLDAWNLGPVHFRNFYEDNQCRGVCEIMDDLVDKNGIDNVRDWFNENDDDEN